MSHGNLHPGVNVQGTAQSIHMDAVLQAQKSQAVRRANAGLSRRLQQTSRVTKHSKSGHTLRDTSARTKRAEPAKPATEQLRAPDNFPFEIMLNILKCLHVREGEKTVFLRPKKSLDEAYRTKCSIDTPIAERRALYNPTSDEQPPMEKRTSPSVNLLQVSKVFRDEGNKLFYRENIFSFASSEHADDVFRRLDPEKRSLIRHVAFESQWGLQLSINSNLSGKIAATFDVEWGNYMTGALDDLPSIESITLRVRCTTHYDDFLQRWGAFEWDLSDSSKVWIQGNKHVLGFLETRDKMRAWVANKVEADYTALGKERYLPMIKITFLWGNEKREWQGNESMWPLAKIERDRAKFGLDRNQEKSRQQARLALATAERC
jgi:hypothetical protein